MPVRVTHFTHSPIYLRSNLGKLIPFFCHYYYSVNSTLLSLLRFSYFITPYDAQASSAFSALIKWGSRMTTCLGFGLLCVFCGAVCQFVTVLLSLLVLGRDVGFDCVSS